MTGVEATARAHRQRAIAEAVRRAIKQACVSADMTPSTETTKTIIEALRDVLQPFVIELDMAVSPDLGRADAFGGKAGE